ncbi:hypothetical protein KMZ32_01790 [Phycicoccus sp. MAQZ13P-2]|uniref:hypothetical protein n=1 Tax=Phycicoccus mangrovi TaxID=2840470 RepID=UPI001C0014A0|nr:hypothetical protein [Phycicoccus mangrovi]MBT9254424.1 hypothetical protein [Phycicoccus mangrovi]MBT9272802.1 hypothetical protein [Phycicoccus mangrovi]
MSIKTGIDLPRQLGLAILALFDRADLETLLGFIEERAGALDAGTGLTGEDVAAVQLVLSWTLDELALPGGTDLVHLAGRFAHLGEFDWPIALEKARITLSPPR